MGYIHGTEPREQRRLSELNRMTNRAFVAFLGVGPGERVLEVGSGLGLLAADVAASAPGVEVTGVERSPDQLAAAIPAPGVRHVQGDAHRLEFASGSFDVVYARYLLEHVADPAAVVSEMHRVIRPGGRIALQENDISLLRLDPPCSAFEEVWAAFAAYQRQCGGDALIGRRLFRLLRNSGFTDIELSVQPELHWHGSPYFESWIRNVIGNITGAAGFGGSGSATPARIDQAVRELEDLMENEEASCVFVWNRAAARSLAPGHPSKGNPLPTAEERNIRVAQRVWDDLWHRGDFSVMDELFGPQFIRHDLDPAQGQGREKNEEFIRRMRDTFPDLHFSVDDVIAKGDKVVTRYRFEGTHLGDALGFRATGNKVSYTGMIIQRFEDGKIVEQWTEANLLSLFRQLNLIPPPQG